MQWHSLTASFTLHRCFPLLFITLVFSGCITAEDAVSTLTRRGAQVHLSSARPWDASDIHAESPVSVEFINVVASDSDLRLVSRLVHLRSLVANQTSITNAGLASLGPLQELEALTLNGTQLTDDGLAHLHPLQELRHLSLESEGFSDDVLGKLPPLPHIQSVRLNGRDATEQDLAELRDRTVRKSDMGAPSEVPVANSVQRVFDIGGYVVFFFTFGLLCATQLPIHLPGFWLLYGSDKSLKGRRIVPAVLSLLIIVAGVAAAFSQAEREWPRHDPSGAKTFQHVVDSWLLVRCVLLGTGISSIGQSLLHVGYAVLAQRNGLAGAIRRMRRIAGRSANRKLRYAILAAYGGFAMCWGFGCAAAFGFAIPRWLVPIILAVTAGKLVEHLLPPYVLLLGSSGAAQLSLQRRLRAVLYPHRVVSLLIERNAAYDYMSNLYHESDCFRTSISDDPQIGDEGWKTVVRELAEIARHVVVDTRTTTEYVQYEVDFTLRNCPEKTAYLTKEAWLNQKHGNVITPQSPSVSGVFREESELAAALVKVLATGHISPRRV